MAVTAVPPSGDNAPTGNPTRALPFRPSAVTAQSSPPIGNRQVLPQPAALPLGFPGRDRMIAVLFAVAWIICPAVQPAAADSDSDLWLWLLPIDLAALALIIAACVALWRGSRKAPRLSIAAGIGMAVETVLCPLTAHHGVGSYLWVQTAMTLFVLLTSAALARRPQRH